MSEEIIKDVIIGENEDYIINLGPTTPINPRGITVWSLPEGETVKYLIPHIGYIHRGIEKMSQKRTTNKVIHLTDRMDYLSAHMNNEAVCMVVEEAMQVEVPERVKYIRTILDELNRLASHQLWWSAFGMDLGALTTFFYGLRDREHILDIFERIVRFAIVAQLQHSGRFNAGYSS